MNMIMCISFVLIHWYLSLFCQSFFLHRFASHRMFEMSVFWQRFFYLLTFIAQGTSFLNPSAYATLHNRHHLHSDEPEDPHSPHQNPNIFIMMWNTFKLYDKFVKKEVEIPSTFQFSVFEGMDRVTDSWLVRLCWVPIYIGIYVYFAPSIYYYPLILVHCFMGPIHGAIVNWCGHKYGYRNYDLDDHSQNTLWVDFLMMGELYQNNHHKACRSWNFARKWFELDLTFVVMRMMQFVGIIRPQSVQIA